VNLSRLIGVHARVGTSEPKDASQSFTVPGSRPRPGMRRSVIVEKIGGTVSIDRTIGVEPGEDGHAVGRDPGRMTLAELQALGHEPRSPLAALRERCLDCCSGSVHEVRLCVAVECPAWPFRLGRNPYRAPPTEAQREAGRRTAAKINAAASSASNGPGFDAGSPSPPRTPPKG
jgi:hypothetical protein